MKTNLENTIKNQLDQRELQVSNEAWDRLTEMMASENPQAEVPLKQKINSKKWIGIISIAASMAILVGLALNWKDSSSSVLPTIQTEFPAMVHENSELKSIPKSENHPQENAIEFVNSDLDYENSTTEKVSIAKTKKENWVNLETKQVEDSKDLISDVVEEKPNKLEEIVAPKESSSELAAHAEPQQEEKKKANFADPEMLLYSIENNQAVKESKSNSKLVLVDFNK